MNIKVAPLSPTKKLGGFIRIRNDRNGPITLSYRYDQDVLEVFDPPFVDETGAYLSHKRCEVRARALLQELNAIRHVVHCVQEDSPFLVIVCFEKIHCRYRTFWYNVLSDTHQELQTWLSGNTIYSTSMARMPSTVNVNKMRFVLAFGMEDGSARVFSIKTEANCDSSVSIQTAVAMIDNDRSPITAVKVVSESLEDCRAGYKYPKVFLGSMTGFLGFFSIRLEENDLVILSKRILTRACIYRKRPIIHLEARRVHLSIILAIGQGGPKECISDGDRTKQAAVRILRYHGNGSLSVINTMTLRFQRELCDIASIRIYQGPNGLCTTAVFREISFPYGLVIKRTIGADKNQNTQSDTDLPFSPTGVLDFLDVNNDYLLLLEQELVKPETVQDDADIIRVVLNTGAISEMENAHRSSAEVSKPQSAGERPVASATEDNELSASTTAHSIADVSTRDILKGFSMDTSKEITCLKDREAIDECIACDGDDANVDISQADNVDEIVSEKENTDNCLAGNGIVGDDSTDEDVAETDIAYDMVVSDCTSDNEATEWDPEDDEAEDNDTPGNCLSYGEIAEDDITQDIIVSEKAPKHGIADNSTTRDPAIGYDDVDHDIKDNAINVYEFTDISSPDADIADDDTSQEDAYNDNPYNDIPDLIIIDDDGASDHDTVDSDNSDDVIYCNDFDGDIASDNSATGNASHDDDVEMSFLEEQRGIGNTVIDHKDDEYDVDIVYDNGDDLQSDQVSIEDSDIDQHEVYHSTESISDASVPNAIEPSPKVPLSEFADFFNALRESSADGKLFLDLLLSEAYPQYKSDIAYLRINGELILSELAKGTLLDQQSHRQALYYLCLLNVDCHLDASLFTFMKEEEQNLVTSYTQFDRGYWEDAIATLSSVDVGNTPYLLKILKTLEKQAGIYNVNMFMQLHSIFQKAPATCIRYVQDHSVEEALHYVETMPRAERQQGLGIILDNACHGEKQPALEDLIKLASYPSNDDDLRQFTSFTLRSSSPVSKVILMHMYASRHEYVKALSTIRLLRKNNDLGDMATAACDKLEISIKEKQPAILTYLPEDIFLSKPGNASRDYEGFFPSHGLAAGPLLFGKAFNSIIRGEKLKMTGEDSLRQAL